MLELATFDAEVSTVQSGSLVNVGDSSLERQFVREKRVEVSLKSTVVGGSRTSSRRLSNDGSGTMIIRWRAIKRGTKTVTRLGVGRRKVVRGIYFMTRRRISSGVRLEVVSRDIIRDEKISTIVQSSSIH